MAPGDAKDTGGELFYLVLLCGMIAETEKEKQTKNAEIMTRAEEG